MLMGNKPGSGNHFAAASAAAFAKSLLYTIRPDKNPNRTKEQRNQPEEDAEKDLATATTVEVVLLPTPKYHSNFPCGGFWASF